MQLRIGRGQQFDIENVDRLGAGVGGRRDHGHDFIVACGQRCGHAGQQIPMVDGAERLGPTIKAGNRYQRAGGLGAAQDPAEEPRRQQRQIHRQEEIKRLGGGG